MVHFNLHLLLSTTNSIIKYYIFISYDTIWLSEMIESILLAQI